MRIRHSILYSILVLALGLCVEPGLNARQAAPSASAPSVPAPADIFTVQKLTDRIYMLSTKYEGGENGEALGNVVFYVSGEGVLVVDEQFEKERRSGQTVEIAQGVLAQIKKVTNEPIRYVINSHEHPDHSGGNLTFGQLAPIIGQINERQGIIAGRDAALARTPGQVKQTESELAAAQAAHDTTKTAQLREQLARQNLQLELAKSPDFEKSIPSITYDKEMRIYLGGEEIRLYHFGPAHTTGDTLVYFTKANIAHWGDTFQTHSNPGIIDGSTSTLSWIKFLDQGLEAVGPTARMVPGHGYVATAVEVQGLKQYFTNLRDAVSRQIEAGKTKDETVEAVDAQFPQYQTYRPGDARFRSNIGSIYNEVKKERAGGK